MLNQTFVENKRIIDLAYLHDVLLPEELDIDRGYNSVGLESENNEPD